MMAFAPSFSTAWSHLGITSVPLTGRPAALPTPPIVAQNTPCRWIQTGKVFLPS